MQRVDGLPLVDFCKKRVRTVKESGGSNSSPRVGPALEASLVRLFDQLAALRVTPNDNNPDNFLIDSKTQKVWRIDFGAAKQLTGSSAALNVWDPMNVKQLLRNDVIPVFPGFVTEVYRRVGEDGVPPHLRLFRDHCLGLAQNSLSGQPYFT
uniref:Protein kinase domain-containing protein n=1 Tax=Fibrocapsa japonica TaxID=94617 RepID=A0A7S2Y0Q2_9STRA|mmetsp:Transcript_7142/g.10707  ORF Transcript_7142/g.10707 Transcript_7142/m.10707 type:complete len:152 (+) Transcript_7142:384-839(+)